MARLGDPRWRPLFTLTTFAAQIVLCGIVLGLTSTDIINDTFSIISLIAAGISIVSTVIYLICYFTSTLHPLVVLTISIEFMMLWLAASVLQILGLVYLSTSPSADNYYGGGEGFVGCQTPAYDPSSWDGYGGRSYEYYNYTTGVYETEGGGSKVNTTEYNLWYDAAKKEQKSACGRGIAGVVFVVLVFISYIWIIIYSAVTRKRTRVPYVKAEKQPLMAQAEEGETGNGGIGTTMRGAGTAAPAATRNERVMEEERNPNRIAIVE